MKKGRGATKLKPEDISQIRILIRAGTKDKEIGQIFNVDKATIRDVRLRKTWSYI